MNLSDNKLTSLPAEIKSIASFTVLEIHVSNNELTSLPAELGDLHHLSALDLSNNKLTSVPPELGNLSSLEYLGLGSNDLTSLPSEIGNIRDLSLLNLSDNELTSLPPEIGNLNKLNRLFLGDNQLSSLPLEIGNLSNLVMLDLSSNDLTSLPSEIRNLTNLVSFRLDNNPFRGPFPESLMVLTPNSFGYGETDLCVLLGRGDDLWLAAIPYVYGNGLPPCNTQVVTGTDGLLSSTSGVVHYEFSANTFTDTTRLTYLPLRYTVPDMEMMQAWVQFTATAVYSATDQPAMPTKPYTITIHYDTLPIINGTAQLYYSDGTQWITNTTHTVDTTQKIIQVVVNDLSEFKDWTVSGESEQTYLPTIQR